MKKRSSREEVSSKSPNRLISVNDKFGTDTDKACYWVRPLFSCLMMFLFYTRNNRALIRCNVQTSAFLPDPFQRSQTSALLGLIPQSASWNKSQLTTQHLANSGRHYVYICVCVCKHSVCHRNMLAMLWSDVWACAIACVCVCEIESMHLYVVNKEEEHLRCLVPVLDNNTRWFTYSVCESVWFCMY